MLQTTESFGISRAPKYRHFTCKCRSIWSLTRSENIGAQGLIKCTNAPPDRNKSYVSPGKTWFSRQIHVIAHLLHSCLELRSGWGVILESNNWRGSWESRSKINDDLHQFWGRWISWVSIIPWLNLLMQWQKYQCHPEKSRVAPQNQTL